MEDTTEQEDDDSEDEGLEEVVINFMYLYLIFLEDQVVGQPSSCHV